MRNFQKLKVISDYQNLDAPEPVHLGNVAPIPESDSMMVLRMLVKPKYGDFKIPEALKFLEPLILELQKYDRVRTGIEESWCYVTIRHGLVQSVTDDEWHFDGSSFRTDIIPERNYVWVSSHPTEYKRGGLEIPEDFDATRHNLFTFASRQLENVPVETSYAKTWYLLSPFCLHRRPDIEETVVRTFYRICFTDIEGRDINNTHNPEIPTPFYGRNPVATFRNKLTDYYAEKGA